MNSKDDFRCAIDEFDPANDDYLSWKKTAELWNTVTNVKAKQKGLALCSRLEGRAKAIAGDLDIDLLPANSRINRIVLSF